MYFLKKQNPERPISVNVKIMHIINTIAILLFVGGITWKLIEWFILKK